MLSWAQITLALFPWPLSSLSPDFVQTGAQQWTQSDLAGPLASLSRVEGLFHVSSRLQPCLYISAWHLSFIEQCDIVNLQQIISWTQVEVKHVYIYKAMKPHKKFSSWKSSSLPFSPKVEPPTLHVISLNTNKQLACSSSAESPVLLRPSYCRKLGMIPDPGHGNRDVPDLPHSLFSRVVPPLWGLDVPCPAQPGSEVAPELQCWVAWGSQAVHPRVEACWAQSKSLWKPQLHKTLPRQGTSTDRLAFDK